MIYILLLITIISNAVMDAVWSRDSYRKYGLWFSKDGYKVKYFLRDYLNKYVPNWLARFLAFDVLVVFTELYKLAKMIMILSFLIAIFGFTWYALIMYFAWGLFFSGVFYLIR